MSGVLIRCIEPWGILPESYLVGQLRRIHSSSAFQEQA